MCNNFNTKKFTCSFLFVISNFEIFFLFNRFVKSLKKKQFNGTKTLKSSIKQYVIRITVHFFEIFRAAYHNMFISKKSQ